MNIPNIMKETISNIFYDKSMEIWTSGTVTDAEGSEIGSGKLNKLEDINGNIQYTTREFIKKEYGDNIQANAIVTCQETVAEIMNILVYDNKDFIIKSKIVSDSHVTLLVEGEQ